MKQYFYLPVIAMAAILAVKTTWIFKPVATVYKWPDGDTVMVYDSTLIDSMGLRGWNDELVKYPINTNDSVNAHIVYLADSEIVK